MKMGGVGGGRGVCPQSNSLLSEKEKRDRNTGYGRKKIGRVHRRTGL